MTAADYAAIAVAPVLIFLMISSLANFLMLVFYQGPNPLRVAWIVLMFTMGFVGIARIAIEQDRVYSLGYAAVLGFAGFVTMSRFLGSPIFCAFILGLIAYLADRIVDDCTLIDDSIDSSGQGLVDFGKKAVRQQLALAKQAQRKTMDESVPPQRRGRGRKSQPGRTVMYLALAALPLFGLGQFMLHDDPQTWQRAQWLLAVYLFSSFSLLVTTSFLGLRRYLRQRGVDMPANVSIGWLAGGVVLTAVIISLAYFVPIPGQAMASVQMPDWLDSPKEFSASRFGWGKEGAAKSKAGDASTSEDERAEGKQTQDIRPEEGAPPGDSGDGKREDGPAGKQEGGKQSQGEQNSSDSKSTSNDAKQSSENKNSPNEQSKSEQPQGQDGERSPAPEKTSPSDAHDASDSSAEDRNGNENSSEEPSDNATQPESNSDDETGPKPDKETGKKSEQQHEPSADSGNQQAKGPPRSTSSPTSKFGDWFSAFSKLLKLILVLVLVGIVGAYLWINREAIAKWWSGLFDRPDANEVHGTQLPNQVDASAPPRPFSSFRNPIGHEQDPRRVMVITFQAFEAWTREHGLTREKDETPSEFLQRVAGSLPQMSAAATNVVNAYNQIVYGRGQPTQADIDAAKAVWQAMN